jgi:hypothetical protein
MAYIISYSGKRPILLPVEYIRRYTLPNSAPAYREIVVCKSKGYKQDRHMRIGREFFFDAAEANAAYKRLLLEYHKELQTEHLSVTEKLKEVELILQTL